MDHFFFHLVVFLWLGVGRKDGLFMWKTTEYREVTVSFYSFEIIYYYNLYIQVFIILKMKLD